MREKWLEFLLGAAPDFDEYNLADEPILAAAAGVRGCVTGGAGAALRSVVPDFAEGSLAANGTERPASRANRKASEATSG
jgi:hypothetical protein